ncbi:MAG TPA: chromosome segregation protein SMC [Candidatus Kapabacteria bacterium]|nr:chromosome segregation protein SMC [Candidatus Kapabacteria bacterium]
MYLSKLEIIGFKSFAQKTLLKFDAGMTAIVGPNGCGKSNVVDAIRWGLGEQRAATLRSDLMENVIFNGTRTRKPLGMSEVSITIENNKGILPTEYQEVTITRRLFRSGESEYLLNKAQCRLRDIVELFMDTGMGANAYSVIELKMIETILSDRTEERRKLFEEAAGVTKYKARRKEALRRLDEVANDLARVDDIVKEVTKSVASLERQAEKAKRHAELSAELRALEIELLEREYAETSERIQPLVAELHSAESQRDRITGELSKYEALLDVIEREESEIEARMISSERSVKEKSEIIQRTRETIIATEERIRALEEQKSRALADFERLEKEKIELSERIASLKLAHERAAQDRSTLEAEKLEKERIRTEAENVVRSRRAELQKARELVYALLNQRNERSNDLERRKARIEELERRLAKFEGEYAAIEEKHGSLEREARTLVEELTEVSKHIATAEAAHQSALDEQEALKAKLDELQNASFAVQNEIGKKISKVEFFTGLVEQGIGAGEGTQYLLSESGWASTDPITVADAFDCDPEYRVAFESALGEIAYYLIVTSSKDAFDAVDVLRHSQKGKATLIALDRVPSVDGVDGVDLPNGARRAISLARFSERYRKLFRMLLSEIAVVDSIQAGFELLDTAPGIERCVTMDGEVITRAGFVKGGSKKSTEGILIGKREQIRELEVDVANLKAELDRYEHEIAETNRTFEAIDARSLLQSARDAEEARRSVQVRAGQVQYELTRTGEQRESLASEESRLKNDLAPLADSLGSIEIQVTEFEARHGAALEESVKMQQVVEEAERLLAEEAQRSTEVQVRFAGLVSEVSRLESETRQTERASQNATQLAEQRQRERERAESDLAEHSAKLVEFRAMLAGLEEELLSATGRHSEVTELRKAKQAEAHKYREALREERQEHDKTINITHELQLKIQELEQKLRQLEDRAKEEFEISQIERKTYSEEDSFSFGDARENVRELKQKIKNLGAVNLLAYDEFQKESERLEFLTTQRRDLSEAQKNLTNMIEEINVTATEQFLTTFEQIRANFQDIFRSLFAEGDTCNLSLEDGKDPLEAQIEILAQPRGKRPHSIDLLSTGEKTLTAIALLFAIYLVKPSPFCILDEVDAPLDDNSIDRFLSIIRRFAANTQFIVVTHNKRTMAAADALYGVTQEEDGVSKIVSVRLKKEGIIVREKGTKKIETSLLDAEAVAN